MLQDEALDDIVDQFHQKNAVLAQFGEQVSAATFYEDIFGDLDLEMPVVIIDDEDVSQKHIVTMTVSEALEQAESRNDMLMGGCTYFNNWISKKSAKDIHSFIIDMDNVYAGVLRTALQNDWYTDGRKEYLPMPTYIVNSGTGLHLYFVLDEPIPNYKISTENLDKLYRSLAIGQTTKRIYLKKQVQWFGQDFRMAGGLNKYNLENTIFRIGDKWDIDKLARAVGLNDVHFVRYGEPRTVQPKAQKARTRFKRTGWRSNRGFYDYALENCRNKTKEGNRYTSMCALSVIAWKCAVPEFELERDLKSLLPKYNDGATRLIQEKEIYSAMKMYNSKAMLTQRERLEDWQGWEYKPIKRNGRTQEVHLQRARAVQSIDYPNGEWREGNGRPKGSNKQQLVYEWQQQHPEGRKVDCERDTGLSRHTVLKWWNTVPTPKVKENITKIVCRGCTIGDRKALWYSFKSSNADFPNNTYMIFEPEPTNVHDPNAVKIVFKGEMFGTAGYVGKEFTAQVKEIIAQAAKYTIELADEKQIGSRELSLIVRWVKRE